MKNRQSGLSLITMLIAAAVLGFLFILAMRTVPIVTEYMSVKKIINQLVDDRPGESTTVADLRRDFTRRARVDYVDSVTGNDLAIVKKGSNVEISIQYERTVPIAGNVSLLFQFDTSASNFGQ